jgi:hypothetical protein
VVVVVMMVMVLPPPPLLLLRMEGSEDEEGWLLMAVLRARKRIDRDRIEQEETRKKKMQLFREKATTIGEVGLLGRRCVSGMRAQAQRCKLVDVMPPAMWFCPSVVGRTLTVVGGGLTRPD